MEKLLPYTTHPWTEEEGWQTLLLEVETEQQLADLVKVKMEMGWQPYLIGNVQNEAELYGAVLIRRFAK